MLAFTFLALPGCQRISPEEYAELPAVQVANAEASESTVTLKTRPLVTQSFSFLEADRPKAALIIFQGGDGNIALGPRGPKKARSFFAHTREYFADNGIAVAMVDTPSDHPAGMKPDFRRTQEHVADIEPVIAYLRKETGAPVWLAGQSRGTASATYITINSKEPVDGLIITSSTTATRNYISVTSMGLDKIKVPILAIAHKDDKCRSTPPSGAEEIVRLAVNAPVAEAKYFKGGNPKNLGGHPCRGGHHGYKGLYLEVANHIINFILKNST